MDESEIKGFKVIYWNAQSMKKKSESLRYFSYTRKPHVIAFSETWLKPWTPDSYYEFNGYTMHRLDRIVDRAGGVSIYVKDSIPQMRIKAPQCNVMTRDCEMLAVKIHRKECRPEVIVSLYRPHRGNEENFRQTLQEALQVITRYYPRVTLYVGGDYNINLAPPPVHDLQPTATDNRAI